MSVEYSRIHLRSLELSLSTSACFIDTLTLAFTALVAMPDGTLYGSVYDDPFPIYQINPLNGETTQTDIDNSQTDYKFSGLTTIPYSKSNTRFIGLVSDTSVYQRVMIDTIYKTINSMAYLTSLSYFFFSLANMTFFYRVDSYTLEDLTTGKNGELFFVVKDDPNSHKNDGAIGLCRW